MLVIIGIIVGAGKLPKAIKSLGTGVKQFKQEALAPAEAVGVSSNVTDEKVHSFQA